MSDHPLSKEKILSSYKDVFDGLGHIGNSSLVTDNTMKPFQHTPRRVPVVLRDEVKDKLSDLEKRREASFRKSLNLRNGLAAWWL